MGNPKVAGFSTVDFIAATGYVRNGMKYELKHRDIFGAEM